MLKKADLSPNDRPIPLDQPVAEKVAKTTCYMCACRCGIDVHLNGDMVRYIEGNRDHPVNKGVLCAKGSAGIMQHRAPARLSKPLRRVGERGEGAFEAISWEEALTLVADKLKAIRADDPKKLAFFTGRDQSQALTGFWAQQFGTPNFAAHGGFCSVNMAAAGMMTLGGSFWEFGEPDWERTKLFVMFGVAEDHASNPIKIGLGKIRARGARFVSVNPVRTGYSAIADDWIGVRPGTDGLLIMALAGELLRAGKVDLDFLEHFTDAGWLVVDAPGTADDGLFARNSDGTALVWDRRRKAPVPHSDPEARPALNGAVTLPDGRKARPVFEQLAERCLDPDYRPEAVAQKTGIAAEKIRALAAEIARVAFDEAIEIDQEWTDHKGRRHAKFIGRPVSFHAMRGISAHANGFQTCRALHIVQMLIGAVDTPGSFRYCAPFPKPVPGFPPPAGQAADLGPNTPLKGGPLGIPTDPSHLLIDDAGGPVRIDKAYSWDAPISAHGMMHTVITNAALGDPYPVDMLFMYMANMAWNSAMNTTGTLAHLTAKREDGSYKIPFFVYADAYYSETVAYADLILPDTTYLERWDCISLLDRPISEPDAVCDAIRQPVVAPDRDVRPFQDVMIDLGARIGLPAFTKEDGSPAYPGGYADYIVNHQRKPGIGPLAGFRGAEGDRTGRGEINPDQLDAYIQNGAFWKHEHKPEARFYKFANQAYMAEAVELGFLDAPAAVTLHFYAEPLQKFRNAAHGHGDRVPPEAKRRRIAAHFDPLPFWYPPFEDGGVADGGDHGAGERYPLNAITQRPMAMYHAWGSMNAWLRQIHGDNPLFIARPLGEEMGIKDGDWVELSSRNGRITAKAKLMDGVNRHTVWTWNAIGKRRGAWNLSEEAAEGKTGFLMNHLIDDLLPADASGYRYSCSDPITGQAAWYDLRVALKKADRPNHVSDPQFDALPPMADHGIPAVVSYVGKPR
ncbi:MAG: molybdopterin oxidoreductase family protein [Alphaproteobacteria bacterium]|nr:molybdopterin oxidoreductase family protein [Alphaproteobacteria bacterium]